MRPNRLLDLILGASVFAVCLVAYRKMTRLWWMWDDPYHLNLFPSTTFVDFFFSRRFWHSYPAHVYTPLQLASLKLDLIVFGLNAKAFYLHQLVAISLGAVALYVALRLALDPIAAAATALVAFLSPVFARTAPQLMTRHYFEGMIFALLAFVAFARRHSILSAVLYLISTFAKEVFVPLPLLLIAIYPKRWRELLPHVGAAAAYSLLRITMVGPLQGYGYTVPTLKWPMAIATVPIRIAEAFVGNARIAGISIVVMVLLCAVFLFVRDRGMRLVMGAATIAAVLPILPVSIDLQSRYAMVAWLLASIAAGLVLRRFALVLLVIAILANRAQWGQTMRESVRMSEEARTFAVMSSNELLLMPLTPPATLVEVRNLTHSPGKWLYDLQPLCAKRASAGRVVSYYTSLRGLREVKAPDFAEKCASIRIEPLSVVLEDSGDNIFWQFGPYREGSYTIVLNDGLYAFSVPPDVGFRLPGVKSLNLRVRYDSSPGWCTYSPDLTIDLSHSERVTWHR